MTQAAALAIAPRQATISAAVWQARIGLAGTACNPAPEAPGDEVMEVSCSMRPPGKSQPCGPLER
jgi:hypothetical protein